MKIAKSIKILASLLCLMVFVFLAAGSLDTEEEPAEVPEEREEEVEVEEAEPEPEPEPEPAFEPFDPVEYEGSGDDIVTVDVPEGEPFLLFASGNQEGRHFAITGFDDLDNQTELFVNTTEPYEGTTLDMGDTAVLEINAPGSWEIELKSINDARVAEVPGSIEGNGDDVFLIEGEPSTAEIVGNSESRHFAVIAYSESIDLMTSDLLVNTTDPYDGRTRVSDDSILFAVVAVGDWQIEFE